MARVCILNSIILKPFSITKNLQLKPTDMKEKMTKINQKLNYNCIQINDVVAHQRN